jgi:predicted MFS family arabinose efflux permease
LIGGAAGLLAIALGLAITEKSPQYGELPTVKALFGVIKNKNLLAMSILAVFIQMVLQSTINTFTSEAGIRAGASLIQLGLLATISSIPTIVASIICGRLFMKRNINLRFILSIGFVLQVAGALIIPFGSGLTAVYTSTLIIGMGCGLCFSTLLSFCTQTVESDRRSAAMGFFQAIYAFGMFIGPVIMGIFVDSVGLHGGFFAVAAYAVIGLILTVIMIKKELQ